MDFCMEIGRYDEFSLFIPNHTRIAGALIQIFIEQETVDNLLSVAARIRDKINPMLFNYALSVAILHRPDTKLLPIPLLANIFPEKFLHSLVFNEARKKGTKLLATSETESESVPVIKVP
uniref:Hemocyanin N-terminal domain-containing protein n=1 Tax=Megaselia scalaris TaxID=36166 RepID=T1H4B2_MEGSC